MNKLPRSPCRESSENDSCISSNYKGPTRVNESISSSSTSKGTLVSPLIHVKSNEVEFSSSIFLKEKIIMNSNNANDQSRLINKNKI